MLIMLVTSTTMPLVMGVRPVFGARLVIRGNSYSGQLASSIRGNSRDRVGVGRAGRLRLERQLIN